MKEGYIERKITHKSSAAGVFFYGIGVGFIATSFVFLVYLSKLDFEKGQISVASGLTSCELVETIDKDKSKSEDWVCTKDNEE